MPKKVKVKHLINKVLYKWIIENFPSCPEENTMSLDCPFILQSGTEVQIKLFPRGNSYDCRKFLSCFLEMKNVGDMELECILEITDIKDNSVVWREFHIKPCEQKVEVGFLKLVSSEVLLNKIARSKSDTLIVKCYLKKTQSETYSITELVARTLIGVNKCSFTWYLDNLDSSYSKRKVMYFPKSTKMEFNLIIQQTCIEVVILKWVDDNIFNSKDDESDRDGGYGIDYDGNETSLVFKVSFLTVEGKILMTHQAWMEFYPHDDESEIYYYKCEKERFEQSFNSTLKLQCEISISCGTYLKHIKPNLSKKRKISLNKTS